MPIGPEYDKRNSKSFTKYVLKKHYDITGELAITECTECGKKRLCQEFEKEGSPKVFVCEQCSFGLTDEEFEEYYEEPMEE